MTTPITDEDIAAYASFGKDKRAANITKRKIGPSSFEVISKQTGRVLGCYGGRDGYKWARTASGKLIAEDVPLSVGVLIGLILAEAGEDA